MPLLSYLYELSGMPEYTYRHHWQVGDSLIWDTAAPSTASSVDTDGQPARSASSHRRRLTHDPEGAPWSTQRPLQPTG